MNFFSKDYKSGYGKYAGNNKIYANAMSLFFDTFIPEWAEKKAFVESFLKGEFNTLGCYGNGDESEYRVTREIEVGNKFMIIQYCSVKFRASVIIKNSFYGYFANNKENVHMLLPDMDW